MGRRKKRQKSENEELRDRLCFLGNRIYILDLLSLAKGKLVCTDENYSYFTVIVEGLTFIYRRANYREDGRKMYRLNDSLGAILGFYNFYGLRYLLKGIQWWRGWTSPQSLKRAIIKYIKAMQEFT